MMRLRSETRTEQEERARQFIAMLRSYGPGCVEDFAAFVAGEKKSLTALYWPRIIAEARFFLGSAD